MAHTQGSAPGRGGEEAGEYQTRQGRAMHDEVGHLLAEVVLLNEIVVLHRASRQGGVGW